MQIRISPAQATSTPDSLLTTLRDLRQEIFDEGCTTVAAGSHQSIVAIF